MAPPMIAREVRMFNEIRDSLRRPEKETFSDATRLQRRFGL